MAATRGAKLLKTDTSRDEVSITSDPSGLFDVQTREGLEAIATVRERFMEDPTTDLSGIRPRIAASWRRSRAMSVDPHAPVLIDNEARIDEQTLICAEPFIREVERLAFNAGADITVITPQGVLIHDLTPSIVDRYPHGQILLESVCGTNGDGTALEEGQSGWVYSQEHYRPDMMSTACYTTLIRDPFRDNVRAAVSLTVPEQVISAADARAVALMMEGMAAKVVRELAKRSASKEQMLFAEYLRVTRRYKTGAVLATDGKNFTLSDPALELLREDDFAAVSSYAQSALRSRRGAEHDLTLSGDRPVRLLVSVIGDASDPIGAILVVRPRAAKKVSRSPEYNGIRYVEIFEKAARDFLPEWVGDSAMMQQALVLAATSANEGLASHLLGEKGTGKRTIATRLARSWSDDVHEIDCSNDENRRNLIEDALAHLNDNGSLILRNVDALSRPLSEELSEALSQVESPKVVLTLTRPNASANLLISTLHSVEISIPPLRSRREDIPTLATYFMAGVTDKVPSPRLLYVLAQADWPGNVTQLKSVVQQAAMSAMGKTVEVADLPKAFSGSSGGSSLSRLEEVELQEVRNALAEAGGNRSLAADILQIGRSTLYRRLDSYRRRGIVI